MKASTDIILSLARNVAEHPEKFDTFQRRWSRLFLVAAQSSSVESTFALLRVSFPACFAQEGWYEYFHERCDALLQSKSAAELSSAQQALLRKLIARYAAFAGTFRVEAHRSEVATTPTRVRTIGIDLRPLSIASSRNRGIGRYLVNTFRHLAPLLDSRQIVLFTEPTVSIDDELKSLFPGPNVSFREFGPSCDEGLDLFLLTDPTPVLIGKRLSKLPIDSCPWVSIVYDFIPLEFPELYLAGDSQMVDEYLENLSVLAGKCAAVFPISRYIGDQCETLLNLPAKRVVPIFGGVDESFFDNATTSMDAELVEAPYFLYVGGADARKNIVGLTHAFAAAHRTLPEGCKLVLVGEMNAAKTAALLSKLNLDHLKGQVIGLGGVDDAKLRSLYSNALATVFVSLSEGLGLPALEAMAMGCPVIASKTSALGETVADCGVVVDPLDTQEIASAMVRAATDKSLRMRLARTGREYAKKWKWENVAKTLLDGIDRLTPAKPRTVARSRRMQIAMVNRDNVWTAPGGDSRIMRQMQAAAALREIDVFFPSTRTQIEQADAIHFVNMTLPAQFEVIAELAKSEHKPLALTTLYEDWPLFLNASHEAFSVYRSYLLGENSFGSIAPELKRLENQPSAPGVKYAQGFETVNIFLTCADSESARLKTDFPQITSRLSVLPFQVDAPLRANDKSLTALYEKLGFDEYVLCIGRLETRKNQLALLAALQDIDVPIVFATGGYTPQAAYSKAVRMWKRKAPIKFIERIPWPVMSALIQGATVHALPSFYELPGLVHLECAAAGVSVVASDWGALEDYLPREYFHACDPLDLESIRSAVLSALSMRPAPAAAAIALSYTQEKLANSLSQVYDSLVTHGKHNLSISNKQIKLTQSAHTPGGLHVAV